MFPTLRVAGTHRENAAKKPRIFVCAVLLISAGTTLGCQRSLFRQNENRTQFESFEVMRGDFAPAAEPDVFGNPQPALRARLVR